MSGTITVKNEISVVVRAVEQALRWAFMVRLGPVADLTALRTAFTAPWERSLCYVTSEGRLYEWVSYSTLTDDNLTVIAPTANPGRWIRVETSLTYGPNDNALLTGKATGFIRSVEVWDGSDEARKQEQVFSRTPALLVEWNGDNPEPLSQYSGALYRNEHQIDIGVVSQCLRRAPAAAFGSPVAAEAEADPGVWNIIGLLRWFLAGIKLDTAGVDFVEIGPASIVTEQLAERVFIGGLSIKVRTSFTIPDEDLVPISGNAQPKLTSFPEDEPAFDPSNWVSAGIEVSGGAGPGLTRNITAGLAIIAGATTTYAGESYTFAASSDTYRDLKPDGSIFYTVVAVGAAPPAIPAGALRIAVTRTDGSGVFEDHWLCGRSVNFGNPFPYP